VLNLWNYTFTPSPVNTSPNLRRASQGIPVKAWRYNSDVETVHSAIESEFYDLESFDSIRDFHRKIAGCQAWYNLLRENSNKGHKTPLQIIKEVGLNIIYPAAAKLPP
jgi:hypothetical protein